VIRQVVVGIDGSQHSLSAFRYAEHFASSLHCELKAVFVVDSRKTELPIIYATGHFDYTFARTYIPPDPELKGIYAKIKKDLQEFAAGWIDSCEQSCRERGIPFIPVQREGLPSSVLAEESRSGDLLIIGQKGENARFERTIGGSTAEDVARSSPRPVLVCPEQFRVPERLLFLYEGSVDSERALQFCVNAFGNLWKEFCVLASVEESFIERELRYLTKHGIPYRFLLEKGAPVDTILEVAQGEKADLILVGSHGPHKLKEYILGSAAVHLLRKSELPVLIVY
jgi:nucleotide-binding universal stress UspA family protein